MVIKKTIYDDFKLNKLFASDVIVSPVDIPVNHRKPESL